MSIEQHDPAERECVEACQSQVCHQKSSNTSSKWAGSPALININQYHHCEQQHQDTWIHSSHTPKKLAEAMFACNHNMFKMSDENRLTHINSQFSSHLKHARNFQHRRVWSCFMAFGWFWSSIFHGKYGNQYAQAACSTEFLTFDQRSCSWINSLKYMKSFSPWYFHWYSHYMTIISPL